DSWSPTSLTNAPQGRFLHTVVWSGNRMVVWGGRPRSFAGSLNTGGRYDPASDAWTPTSTTSVPSVRYGHTAVWTGTVMIVWGGIDANYLNSGGRYDPANDSWSST